MSQRPRHHVDPKSVLRRPLGAPFCPQFHPSRTIPGDCPSGERSPTLPLDLPTARHPVASPFPTTFPIPLRGVRAPCRLPRHRPALPLLSDDEPARLGPRRSRAAPRRGAGPKASSPPEPAVRRPCQRRRRTLPCPAGPAPRLALARSPPPPPPPFFRLPRPLPAARLPARQCASEAATGPTAAAPPARVTLTAFSARMRSACPRKSSCSC